MNDIIDRIVRRKLDNSILNIVEFTNYVYISRYLDYGLRQPIELDIGSFDVINESFGLIEVEINEDWGW